MSSYLYERTGDMFNPALKTSPWEKVQLWFSTRLARIRLWLRKHGIPIAPAFEDQDAVYDRAKAPAREWVWSRTTDVNEQVGEVLAWIDEAVLRAPVIAGLDKHLLGIGIYRLNRRQLAWESAVFDKYGWRKQGRADMEEWLTRQLSQSTENELAITAQTLCLANVIQAVRKY